MGYDIIREDVPGFRKRLGDRVIQGSNNTIIILGTDRAKPGPATIDDGILEKGAGTIHIIAGRAGEDPDMGSDASFLYVSQKTDADANLNLGSVEKKSPVGPALIGKSDDVRLVYRKILKVSITDGSNYIYMDDGKVVIRTKGSTLTMDDGRIIVNSGKVELGDPNGIQHPIILGDSFQTFFSTHTHPTPVGPSGPPTQPMTPDMLSLVSSTQ